jgi:DNA-directed RNA polymerase subunit L
MADFIDMVDDDLYEHEDEDEDVVEDGIQETVKKSLELSKEIDDLKIAIDTCTDLDTKKLLSDKVQKLSEWSEQVKKTVSEVEPEYVSDSGKVVPLVDEDPQEDPNENTSEVSNG